MSLLSIWKQAAPSILALLSLFSFFESEIHLGGLFADTWEFISREGLCKLLHCFETFAGGLLPHCCDRHLTWLEWELWVWQGIHTVNDLPDPSLSIGIFFMHFSHTFLLPTTYHKFSICSL